jgi:hypothetical protein
MQIYFPSSVETQDQPDVNVKESSVTNDSRELLDTFMGRYRDATNELSAGLRKIAPPGGQNPSPRWYMIIIIIIRIIGDMIDILIIIIE